LPAKKISQKDKIKKIYLKPQKDVGKNELKLPRSGFVHQRNITTFLEFQKYRYVGDIGNFEI